MPAQPGQFEYREDVVMRDVGHFIGGKVVKGTSGRQGDVFKTPMVGERTGDVPAIVVIANPTLLLKPR